MNTNNTLPLVLLVDDKPEIAKIISIYTKGTYRTEHCTNGRSALDRLKNGELPSIIVSDVNMPDMDGYQFLEAIKQDPSLTKIPVIILSSIESSADRVQLFNMGAADFMLKPFNPEELKVRIRRFIQ